MSVAVARDFEGHHEFLTLPDGTQLRIDQLTKAQQRIIAAKARNREEQLNNHLLSYAVAIREKCSNIASEKSYKEVQSAITRQIKNTKNGEKLDLESATLEVNEAPKLKVDEVSAIEKQKQAWSEKSKSQFDAPRSRKQRKLKWHTLKSIGQKFKP